MKTNIHLCQYPREFLLEFRKKFAEKIKKTPFMFTIFFSENFDVNEIIRKKYGRA